MGCRMKDIYPPSAPSWDHLASRYAAVDTTLDELPYEKLFPSLENNSSVLDLGCGSGRSLGYLRDKNSDAFGLDYSIEMLRRAKSYGPVVRADFRALPFGKSKFDLVYSRVAISYVPNWDQALIETERVLSSGGYFLVSFVNRWSFLALLRAVSSLFGITQLGRTYHMSLFELTRVAKRIGFQRVRWVVDLKKNTVEAGWKRGAYGAALILDGLVNKLIGWWGGDVVVLLIKRS